MKSHQKSLRQLIDEFEALVAWFDGDDLDVEAAIAKFEQGEKLAEQISQQLRQAKIKVEIVKKRFDQAADDSSDNADNGSGD
jgi:exodeoxyribonuclease VII small subunit